MSWFGDLISDTGASVVDAFGDAIDKNVTSDEERLKLRNELEGILSSNNKILIESADKFEHEVTERHKADMASDSWLSKNIRPMALIYLTVTVTSIAVGTIFGDLTESQRETLQVWVPLFTTLLTAAYVFYFGGRSHEKATKIKSK